MRLRIRHTGKSSTTGRGPDAHRECADIANAHGAAPVHDGTFLRSGVQGHRYCRLKAAVEQRKYDLSESEDI